MIDSEIRLEKKVAQLMERLIVVGYDPGEDWISKLSNHLRVVMK